MKIIYQGIDPNTVPVQAKCNHCRTAIEFLPSEAKLRSDPRDGNAYEIACPTCKRPILTAVPRRNSLRD